VSELEYANSKIESSNQHLNSKIIALHQELEKKRDQIKTEVRTATLLRHVHFKSPGTLPNTLERAGRLDETQRATIKQHNS
jgi:hypothetical protein